MLFYCFATLLLHLNNILIDIINEINIISTHSFMLKKEIVMEFRLVEAKKIYSLYVVTGWNLRGYKSLSGLREAVYGVSYAWGGSSPT